MEEPERRDSRPSQGGGLGVAVGFVLDAYAARSCPLKTVYRFTPGLVPLIERPPDPPFFHDADAIESEVFARLLATDSEVADLRSTRTGESAQRATIAAMRAGAPLILGPTLPQDAAGHRAGHPSMLVRETGDGPGYHPVQIKFHRVLESASVAEPPLYATTLDAPRKLLMVPGRRFRWRHRLPAALQLAHYWRMLEASGYAGERPAGGLIGLDRVPLPGAQPQHLIAWLNLSAQRVPQNPASVDVPGQTEPVSVLDRYDEDFAVAVGFAEAASRTHADASPPIMPTLTAECRGCVWRPRCIDFLDADDLTLRLSKSPLDVHEVATLRRLGVGTVKALAKADVDALLPAYLPSASHREDAELRLRRVHHRARLLDAGLALERETSGTLPLPHHGVEIDLDIETSASDRVYLWGFWVDDPDVGEPYVRQFAAFADLDAAAERALAAEAMGWLRSVVAGKDAAVYHYSDYEVVRLGKLATHLGELGAWAQEWAAEHFVDLFAIVRENFFGANGLGLKVVASAVAGFAWRDEDPGGLNSQRWFEEAVHSDSQLDRNEARLRVLEYNEDDVRATWHLRRWLRSQD